MMNNRFKHGFKDALHDVAALHLTEHRYGILPPSVAGVDTFEDTFRVKKVLLKDENMLHVVVEACQAITTGGVRIALPAFSSAASTEADGAPATKVPFPASGGELDWWIVLIVDLFETQPAGIPDLPERPQFSSALPTYTIQVVNARQFKQFINHPFALTIGKVFADNNEISVEDYYIPPSFSVNAHPVLVNELEKFNKFLALLEKHCIQVVQKNLKRSQKNDIAELVMFLCDRMVLYLGQVLTTARWMLKEDSPAALFYTIASLARVIKNTIELRIGSGKDKLMKCLSECSGLKQDDLQNLLNNIADMAYEHYDVNKNMAEAVVFVKIISETFEKLSELEFNEKQERPGSIIGDQPPVKEISKNSHKPGLWGKIKPTKNNAR